MERSRNWLPKDEESSFGSPEKSEYVLKRIVSLISMFAQKNQGGIKIN